MDFIKINNRKNFIVKHIPTYHPASANYITYWRGEKKKIIEGYWGPDDANIKNYDVVKNSYDVDTDKWRFMPPQLYFYVNYGIILHNDENAPKTAPKVKMRPLLRDVEWEFFYNWLEARGFSGFADDEEFTCNREVKKLEEGDEDAFPDKTCYNSKGELKKFVPAHEYLRRLFPKPMGLPLYMNEARNLFMLGSRGFGKSYMVGVGVVLHELLTDGAKVYTQETIEHPATVEIFVGAALSSKSADILSKTVTAFKNMPGTWMRDTDQEVPNPLWKEMAGTLEPNNMKNPWRHEYTVKVNGRWKTKGSGSNVKHGIYTIDNPEAAAGTRPGVMVIEEVGLLSNVLNVHSSNEYCQVEGTTKFGSAVYLGTGGSMEKIVESEIIFRDPETYNFLAFDDIWEGKGKIGYFVPAYYALIQFKDQNGNTDEERARNYLLKIREKKKKAKNSMAYIMELMSRPIVPSEMFMRKTGNMFPIEDLKDHLSNIEFNDRILDSSWKVDFGLDEQGNPVYREATRQPIRNFPLKNGESMLGCVEVFEMPRKQKDGTIPAGRYIIGTDPVDDDGNENIGLSLQSSFVLDTWTDRIVAEYTERTEYAYEYYEQLRRLAMYYNAKINYEQNKKGLYAYFKNHKSLHLLAETPQIISDKDLVHISRTGNRMYGTQNSGGKLNRWGIELITTWLTKVEEGDEETSTPNYLHIRSVGLLKELIAYDGEINADRISAMIMLMIYREDVFEIVESSKKNVKGIESSKFWDKHYTLKRKQLNRRRAQRSLKRALNW
jgi:hypothetical protein